MSETCRMVRSARWPCLTRLRALGRYLKTTILSPRSWRTTSALTRAPFTSGWPMAARSSSATSRTRSTSSRSTASSVPSWTRYCLPPLSMTAYMVPLRLSRARGGRREAGRRVRGREEGWYCRGRQASNEAGSGATAGASDPHSLGFEDDRLQRPQAQPRAEVALGGLIVGRDQRAPSTCRRDIGELHDHGSWL